MRTLLILAPEVRHLDHTEQHKREAADECPRISLLEDTLSADVLDGAYLQSLSGLPRMLCKLLPAPIVQAWMAYRRRRRYDVVISWDDRVAVIYAFLLKLTRSRSRHVAILSWMAPPKKAFTLKLVQKHIDRIILWSESQKALLVEFFGISSSRVAVIPYWVDQQFWRPMESSADSICSAGNSRRDYATLVEATRGLAIPCHIVTNAHLSHESGGDYGLTGSAIAAADMPDNVTIGPASSVELRAAYARSHFVVVPLFPGFRDSGITSIAEAMAMGKAVICSRIYGQIDFVEDGKTGLFVPPGDPQALRAAIQYLWDHPDIAAQMGTEGRKRAEDVFALDHFVANVRQIAEDVMTGQQTPLQVGAEQLYTTSFMAASQGE
jgi:glycosyltransferase involved in cell wall biosynthesis